ncbi:hypothetical protein EU527_11870 [Candidatus Thorarchaeota archaeon]|nr:MAG: hypothetical protein EU527_11870 [Candidatus Thorarchaeota archaeon]
MTNRCISRTEILRNTLFHIQVKQCQYIDDFPEAVTSIFDSAVERKGFKEYDAVRRKLYRIKTNFFKINNIKKKEFFEGLYTRLQNKTR